nr:cytochrome p450 [Quercus suber]
MFVNDEGGSESNECNLTFLHGSRSCIGGGFAKAELRLIIAMLFSRFHATRLPHDDGSVKLVGSLMIKPEGGLLVNLIPTS